MTDDFIVHLPVYDGKPYDHDKVYKTSKHPGLQLLPTSGTRVPGDTVILAGYEPYWTIEYMLSKYKKSNEQNINSSNNNMIDNLSTTDDVQIVESSDGEESLVVDDSSDLCYVMNEFVDGVNKPLERDHEYLKSNKNKIVTNKVKNILIIF